MLFFERFSMRPMPSRTLVMSQMRRFCTPSSCAAAFRSRTPSCAVWIRETNFLVSKPRLLS